MKAYYNGKFGDLGEISVPLTDRSIFFGDGVYDAMIGENGRIDRFSEHMERLIKNAAAIGLPLPLSAEEIKNLIATSVKESGYSSYFIYVQLSRSGKERKHAWEDGIPSNLLITVKPHTLPRNALKLTCMNDVRYSMCNVKTINLLPNVIAAAKAEARGFDEAVFIRGGFVTECAHSNISIIKNGALITHPDSPFILPGITKRHLIADAKALGISVFERPFTKEELFSADSVIVSSTSRLLSEAEMIDGKMMETGKNEPSSLLISRAFDDYRKRMEI